MYLTFHSIPEENMKTKIFAMLLILSLLFVVPGCGPAPTICNASELMASILISPPFWGTVGSLTPTLTWQYPTSLYDYSYPVPYYIGASGCVPEKFRVTLRTGPFFTDDLGGYTVNGSTMSWTPSTPLQPGKEYSWGIQAMVGGVYGPYAGNSYFFTGPTCATSELVAPILEEPTDGEVITEDYPSLIWIYPDDCAPEGYRIDLSTTSDFSDTSLSGGTGNPSTRWGPGHVLDDCETYYWKVAAINGITLGPSSLTSQFRIDVHGTCPLSSPWPLFHFVAAAPCNIGPGPEFAVMETLQAGETRNAEGRNEDGNWLLLRLDPNRLCWVGPNAGTLEGERLSLPLITSQQLPPTDTPTTVPSGPPTDTPTTVPGSCKFTFRENGNCRSGPGVIYGVLTSGPAGTIVPADGRNADASWYHVQLYGVSCYVSANVGFVDCDPQGLPILKDPPTPTPSATPFIPSDTPIPLRPTNTFTPIPIPVRPTNTFTPVPVNCALYTDEKSCELHQPPCVWLYVNYQGYCTNR